MIRYIISVLIPWSVKPWRALVNDQKRIIKWLEGEIVMNIVKVILDMFVVIAKLVEELVAQNPAEFKELQDDLNILIGKFEEKK